MDALAFGIVVVPLLMVVGLAFIPANIAGKKGYSAVGFYFFGLFLFLPALIVALVIQDKSQPVYAMQQGVMQSIGGAMPRHIEVASSETEHYFSGSPLLLVHDVLQKDEVSGQRLIRCTFQNLTEETVIAVYISLECKSVDGSQTQGVDEFVYMDLYAEKGSTFGDDELIALPDATTKSVKLRLQKVVFADGKVWHPKVPATFEPVELPTPLSELGMLEAQYRRDIPRELADTLLHNLPSKHKGYWRCCCGQINPIQGDVCLKCNTVLTTQLALKDEATLKQHLEEFEREKARLEVQRRRRLKRIGIGLAAAAVLVAAVVGVSAGIASIAASTERSSLAAERQAQLAALPEGFKRGAAFSGWMANSGSSPIAVRNDGSVAGFGTDEWSGIVAVAAGSEIGVFGLKEDGTVLVAPVGSYAYDEPEPSQSIAGWSGITQITASEVALFGVKDTGTVEVVLNSPHWEAPKNSYHMDYGQFEVAAWSGIAAVATTWDATFGLKEDGTVIFAQGVSLHVNDEQTSYDAVENWTDVVAIAGGRNHVVGLKKDGTVVATGSKLNGQCDTEGWNDIIAVSAAPFYTVGLKEDGSLVMVGNPVSGAVGEECLSWSNIVAIQATDFSPMGLKADGTVVAVAPTAGDARYLVDRVTALSNIGRFRQP